jgi:DNA polymerase I-like protein with 3'-5' exonuclease and polymerase domains
MLYTLYGIEQAGIHTKRGLEFTQYNPYTSTGRPSNRYGGINYAALNKEDGSRDRFVSRFDSGKMLEFDFDAYHIRLMAEVVGYKFPDTSVHEYLGKQYFGKDELTEEEYRESKALSFKIVYGGIPKEMREIEFFGKIHAFTRELWKKFKSEKFITTYLLQRRLHADNLTEMNAPKLFNYYLQALETESNVLILKEVFKVLGGYKSKLVLYTYDSFTFDYDPSDGEQFFTDIKNAMKYPVKGQIGDTYNTLESLVFEHAI